MANEFNKEKIVPKEKKRGAFRLIGIVIPNITKPEMVLGYVLLDVKNYKIIPVIPNQFITMIKHYTFENVMWNAELEEIESTETNVKDYKKKIMQFDGNGKVIGNHGYTILAKIISGNEVGFKILDYNLRIADVREDVLIKTVQGNKIPILNAKIREGTQISALKDSFHEIYKEKDKNSGKRKTLAETKEEHNRHLEKIIARFKRSVIDMSMFANFSVVNTFPEGALNDKAHKRFIKDLNIFVKEYAKIHHPSIVEKAELIYGKSKGKLEYEKAVGIMMACMFVDTFITKKFSAKRPFIGIDREWVSAQFFNNKFKKLLESTKYTELVDMLNVITTEQKYLSLVKEKMVTTCLVDHNYYPRARTSKAYRDYIIEDYAHSKAEDGFELVAKLYNIYASIKNAEIKRYLSMLPICETIGRVELKKEKKKANEVIVKLNMRSQKGIRNIGYCVNPKEAGNIHEENILYTKKPLRYVLEDTNLSKAEESAIIKKSTCFGDMLFAGKLLRIKEYGLSEILRGKHFMLPYDYRGSEREKEVIRLINESIMTILAIYNLELAIYLNDKYKFVDLDLDAIGHEEFPLEEEDKIYYQTGGKFNKSEIIKNTSWSGLSNMPMGLRTAIALNATNSVPLELEKLLNYLYTNID